MRIASIIYLGHTLVYILKFWFLDLSTFSITLGRDVSYIPCALISMNARLIRSFVRSFYNLSMNEWINRFHPYHIPYYTTRIIPRNMSIAPDKLAILYATRTRTRYEYEIPTITSFYLPLFFQCYCWSSSNGCLKVSHFLQLTIWKPFIAHFFYLELFRFYRLLCSVIQILN